MAEDDAAKRAWISRVLGKEADRLALGADVTKLREAVAQFHDALAEVGGRVEAVHTALRATGNASIRHASDTNLSGLLDGMRVKLSAKLYDLLQAPAGARQRHAVAARTLIAQSAKYVGSSEVIALLDSNPFGIKVDAREGLQRALASLDHQISASAG